MNEDKEFINVVVILKVLVNCHNMIQRSLRRSLELSMGMSDDYLQAVSILVKLLI